MSKASTGEKEAEAPQFIPVVRPYSNWHMESSRWDEYKPMPKDIVVATLPKSGTTWMMALLYHLLKPKQSQAVGVEELSDGGNSIEEGGEGGRAGVAVKGPTMWEDMPMTWLDVPINPMEKVRETLKLDTKDLSVQRIIKSHTPRDGMPLHPTCKYIVMMRDLRDVAWSWHHHWRSISQEGWKYFREAERVYGVFPTCPETPEEVFRLIMRQDADFNQQQGQYHADGPIGDGFPFHMWSFCRSWWEVRNRSNVVLLHYAKMLQNLESQVRRVVDFLGMELSDTEVRRYAAMVEFSEMKKQADRYSPFHKDGISGGHQTFFNKGRNRRWEGRLTSEEVAAFERRAVEELGEDCAAFMLTGERLDLQA